MVPCQSRENFSLLCYRILSLALSLRKYVNYSDDTKLVGRAHAIDDIIKIQHDLKPRMHSPSQEDNI